MNRPRLSLVVAGLLIAAGFLVALDAPSPALAKGKDAHLRYAPTYAAAVAEAKARNAFIFVTFHKDG
ncbi:MAG: hypothetical protein O2894_14085 [Planctomycetota bacterium]|nr:hypothetical protein [Planctomycetota bacterium]